MPRQSAAPALDWSAHGSPWTYAGKLSIAALRCLSPARTVSINREMAGRLATWLCPTELDRTRLLDNSVRIRRARSISSLAVGAALGAFVPRYGWWIVVLFLVAAANSFTVDARCARSARPQLHIAASIVLIQSVLAIAVVLTGGPESLALPWIVLPTAFSAARFRGTVVTVAVLFGIALMLAATIGADAAKFAHDPEPLLVTSVLLISVTAVVYVLSASEVEQRGEAVLDHLTGVLNRTSLQRRFEELAEQAALTDEPIALIVLDIDRFKAINDEQGHARGDAVLRDVAYEVRKQLRSFELVYRLGGEEFLVVLPGTGTGEAAAVAERLRVTLAEAQPGGLAVTASFGVAGATGAAVHFDDLFAEADASLYRAKATGRNRVEVAGALPLVA
jgi:diguanylate cyclase (GGDEF)-like protein